MRTVVPSSHFKTADLDRAATGIEGLDDILGGGFPKSRLYLVQGDPGVGKTTLALQFLFDGVKSGEAGLYITLSETHEELEQVSQSHGWDLSSISILEMDAENVLSPDAQNTLFHSSEIELNETTSKILEMTERVKPSRVVFDSLSELRLLSDSGLRFRRQILALKQHFASLGITVLLLDDLTATTPRELQSLAHGVVTLERINPEYGAERRRLFVNKLRGSQFRGGYHDFSIQPGGLMVYPRLVAAEHFTAFENEMVDSGLKELDDLTGGGLSRGTSTLFMGAAGSGKSTLLMQYLLAALKRGEKVALYAFEEGAGIIISRAANMGYDLSKPIREGQLLLQQVDPAELSPGEFSHAVREVIEKQGVTVIAIDSLNGYLYSMPEERHLILHLHELLTYLGQKGILTLMVTAQSGVIGNHMTNPVDLSYLADAVMLLRHFELMGEMRQAISMIKKRSGAHEHTIRQIRITSSGIRLGSPLSEFRGVFSGIPEFIGAIESASSALDGGTEN